ncbi:putative transmembrane protein [Cedratvirus kamchatka]|uniref:Transmembrane protein n=1 Tax=Cedratvirus kamchatka TaxID=2716914 RepID=A0A6G8MZA9_9VIRU|nr:putative transmembrane protein [Cedratvirus kamchatka]WIL05000.1 putative membrane protein [Cedratvirus duvanny]
MSHPRFKVIGDAYLAGYKICAIPIGMAIGYEESLRKQPFSVGLFRMACKSLLYAALYPVSMPYMLYNFPDVKH